MVNLVNKYDIDVLSVPSESAPVYSSHSRDFVSSKALCCRSLKYLCSDFSSPTKQLHLIYISIAACLGAVTVALILTIFFGPPQVTPHGFFTSEFGSCSAAGKDIARRGGNAVDALTSMIICLSVTRPDIISLGGCGAFLVHKRDTDSNELFDAMCTSASDSVRNRQSAGETISVPGLVAGLKDVHDAFGKLYWSDVFKPAIAFALSGFPAHSDLLANLKKFAEGSSYAKDLLASIDNGIVGPQPNLEKTLRRLAKLGPMDFYNGSIAKSIVTEMQNHGFNQLLAENLNSYQVQQPKQVELGMAGFSIFGFPAPFVGGTLSVSVLANLDLLNRLRPLNARKLALGDAKEVALLYHRLFELTKLASGLISQLGDPYDLVIGKEVADLEKAILNLENRTKLVELVKDDRVLSPEQCIGLDPIIFNSNSSNTYVLSVESDMLIASATLTMGGTFGSGIVAGDTGVLLNSAQRLFSERNGSTNAAARGRRPLLPASPLFFETAKQKCGHRFVAAASGGLSGMLDLNQVLTSAFMYLSNVTCTGDGAGLTNGPVNKRDLPKADETTATYTPAVGACLPLNDSLDLKRFSLGLAQGPNNTLEFTLTVEPNFDLDVIKELVRLGHKVEFKDRATSVGVVGWTLYTTIGGVRKTAVNSSASF